MQDDTQETYLSVKQISARYSVGVASLWRWASDPKNEFPKPKSLTPGCTRWKLSDLEMWEASRGVA